MNIHPENKLDRLLKLSLDSEILEERKRQGIPTGLLRFENGSREVIEEEEEETPPEVRNPRRREIGLKNILVPTDFSPLDSRALLYARQFAAKFSARLTLLHVAEPVTYAPPYCRVEDVENLQATLQKAAEKALAAWVHGHPIPCPEGLLADRLMVFDGDPTDQIVRIARQYEIDLIIMATNGRTGLEHLVMGSTAEKVVRLAACPVLIIPHV